MDHKPKVQKNLLKGGISSMVLLSAKKMKTNKYFNRTPL